MSKSFVRAALCLSFPVLAVAAGCSSSSSGTSSSSSGGTSGGTSGASSTSSSTSSGSSSSFCCGINSSYYDCPNQAALTKCGNFSNPDPSQCTKRAAACGGGGSSSGASSSGASSSGASSSGTSSSGGQPGDSCPSGTCASGNTCITQGSGNPAVCAKNCGFPTDCPISNSCCALSNVPQNVCINDNFTTGLKCL